jgi:hypothetical protein
MLRDQHVGEALGNFAGQLVADVEADRQVLEALARQVGEGPSLLKDATGWLGAKIIQLKLGRSTAGTLGTFQVLEILALGVLGKLALWRALIEVAPSDARLSGVDFSWSIDRTILIDPAHHGRGTRPDEAIVLSIPVVHEPPCRIKWRHAC